jgi:nicotinamidase-related amidase
MAISRPEKGTVRMKQNSPIPQTFFGNCAFISVDFQQGEKPKPLSDEGLPKLWRDRGFAAEDVNAANEYAWAIAGPNAVRVLEACRRCGMPRIFIHWGCLYQNGMDVDPEIRQMQLKEHGKGSTGWVPHVSLPGSRPAATFHVREDEYVLPKTGQNAFTSSNLEFLLKNLGVRNIVFVGGHTGACLGKTAKAAKDRGYSILCVEDATFDARESARIPNIENVGYHYVLSTDHLVESLSY